MDTNGWTSLGAFVGVNFAAASSGGIFRPGAWYARLRKPRWTPANWVFPLVWTTLLILNASAGWLVWRASGPDATGALTIYGVSLVLNALWSALFFGLRRMRWALFEVTLLWLSLAAVIVAFVPHSRVAAWLVVPYIAWVTVAAALNRQMLLMNPQADAGAARARFVGAR